MVRRLQNNHLIYSKNSCFREIVVLIFFFNFLISFITNLQGQTWESFIKNQINFYKIGVAIFFYLEKNSGMYKVI